MPPTFCTGKQTIDTSLSSVARKRFSSKRRYVHLPSSYTRKKITQGANRHVKHTKIIPIGHARPRLGHFGKSKQSRRTRLKCVAAVCSGVET